MESSDEYLMVGRLYFAFNGDISLISSESEFCRFLVEIFMPLASSISLCISFSAWSRYGSKLELDESVYEPTKLDN